MTVRAFVCLSLLTVFALGCDDPVGVASNCFDTGECSSGECIETVYGRFCLLTCEADMVRCDDFEACVEGETFIIDGGVDAGVDSPDGGVDGGTEPDAGVPTGAFVCLPGDLNLLDFTPVEIGLVCTYSLDCAAGGICICLDGENCDLEDPERDGPVCVEICDPTMVNRCPFQQACVDLGNGRGFCDPNTEPAI
ncbi:MAG: hypothetical protein WBG86_22985 [Polyangiales bacterium]